MNSQSMGALLILGGLFMLWCIWSNRSPFKIDPEDPKWTGPKNTGPSGGSGKPGGGSGFE